MRKDFLVIDDTEIYGFDQAEKAVEKAIAILGSPSEQFDDTHYYMSFFRSQFFDAFWPEPLAEKSPFDYLARYLLRMSDSDSLVLVKESKQNDFCRKLILRKVTINEKESN